MTSKPGLFVSYLRVSTTRQGQSGLGIEAQRDTVAKYIDRHHGTLLAEFVEHESGKRNARPQLAAALAAAREAGACLVIAKIDRLARNAHFLLSVVEGCGKAGVTFCDLPDLPPGPMGKFLITMLAAVAELEGGMISQRTKAALQAAKARGKVLGTTGAARGAENRAKAAQAVLHAKDVLIELRNANVPVRKMPELLNRRGVATPSGAPLWTKSSVHRALGHLQTS